jgi:hypothetical protein
LKYESCQDAIFITFLSSVLGNTYRILAGKPEGKRPVGRPRCRLEDNIKMDLREMAWGRLDWIHVTQDRNQWRALVSTIMKLEVP